MKYSDSMKEALDPRPKSRVTLGVLLSYCTDEELIHALKDKSGEPGYHQLVVMMRQELARRYPEHIPKDRQSIPIEYRIDWELTCKPFRELSKRKKELEGKG